MRKKTFFITANVVTGKQNYKLGSISCDLSLLVFTPLTILEFCSYLSYTTRDFIKYGGYVPNYTKIFTIWLIRPIQIFLTKQLSQGFIEVGSYACKCFLTINNLAYTSNNYIFTKTSCTLQSKVLCVYLTVFRGKSVQRKWSERVSYLNRGVG